MSAKAAVARRRTSCAREVLNARRQLTVFISSDGRDALIRVAGDLDIAGAPALRDAVFALVRDGVTDVVVDLAEVEFIDSSGLSVLVSGHKHLHERDGELRLRSVPAQAARVLRVTGLDRVLAIDDARRGGADA